MATFYLIRHGHNDWLGKGLAGRLSGVHLNAQGRLEAERLASSLAGKGIQRIISSPLERARETAGPLAEKINLPVEISEAVLEVDFGDWNGALIEDLNKSKQWALFNTYRSGAQIPNGETMSQIQTRMILALERWRRESPNGTFAIFSHGDPIRLALVYYLGAPIDMLTRIEVSPGSCNILRLEESGAQVWAINSLPE